MGRWLVGMKGLGWEFDGCLTEGLALVGWNRDVGKLCFAFGRMKLKHNSRNWNEMTVAERWELPRFFKATV